MHCSSTERRQATGRSERPTHLQLHSVDGVQHPAHRAVTAAHQHPHAAGGQQCAQLEGLGGTELGEVEHLEGGSDAASEDES